jgi:hypothetical protein
MKHGEVMETLKRAGHNCYVPSFVMHPRRLPGEPGELERKGDSALQAGISLIAEREVDNTITEPESICLGSAAFCSY